MPLHGYIWVYMDIYTFNMPTKIHIYTHNPLKQSISPSSTLLFPSHTTTDCTQPLLKRIIIRLKLTTYITLYNSILSNDNETL